jgi:hypothetical protein
MSFDMTGASAYVELHSTEFAMKATSGAKTASILYAAGAVQSGVKGSSPVLTMDADVVLQDGSTCSRNAAGDVRLADVMLTVKPLKDQQNLCPKALTNTYFVFGVKKGTSPENGFMDEFVNQIMTRRAEKLNGWVEQLLWKGDTALVGANNLKWIDGILKQIAAVVPIVGTGTTVWQKLQTTYMQVPIDIRRQEDFRIFIGEDDYELYIMEMANRNLFINPDNKRLHGTLAIIEPVPGLNGTHTAVFTRLSNLRMGIDGDNETDKAELKYSIETNQWYQDFWFTLGVKVIFLDEIFKADITPDPEPAP